VAHELSKMLRGVWMPGELLETDNLEGGREGGRVGGVGGWLVQSDP